MRRSPAARPSTIPRASTWSRCCWRRAISRRAKGHGYMPSFADAYSDAELAAVANYAIHHFGGKAGEVTAQFVHQQRSAQ